MKNAMWLGASAWVVAALLLPGCGASEGSSNHETAGDDTKTVGSGEGTNTGNGSCEAPWCNFPRVLTGDDGKTYGGALNIYSSGGTILEFQGGEVLDTAAGCVLAPRAPLGLPVPIVLVGTEIEGAMHFQRESLTSAILAADLTLTPALDVSGTITARLTTDEDGNVRLDDPNPSANTWTTVFTVAGKARVSCWENQSSVTLQRSDNTTVALACSPQPVPSGDAACDDTVSP